MGKGVWFFSGNDMRGSMDVSPRLSKGVVVGEVVHF
jgi:hypothetical protein